MAQNSVASNLLMLVILVGGFMAASSIKKEVFPEVAVDYVNVSVPYPGASPEEVEKGIILAVEEAVSGLDNVKNVTSTASEGAGNIWVEIVSGGDLGKLSDDIKNELDRITSLPEDAEEPMVSILMRKIDVMSFALYGDTTKYIMHEYAEQIRDEMLQHKDISNIEMAGTRPLEIKIEVPLANLRKYDLTLAQIADTIKAASIELPAGSVKTTEGEILIRMQERRDFGDQFADIPIITQTGTTPVYLGDIAQIKDGFADVDISVRFNGKEAVTFVVTSSGDKSPLEVAAAVKEFIAGYNKTLPEGMGIAVVNDMSDIFRQRIDLLTKNGMLGWMLVVILLATFLELRLAFWVALGVPISFLGAFFIMPYFDVSVNMVSLFAFIISLGIVVDDAIVIGENVYSYIQKGMPIKDAVIVGAQEVALPVTFSILTNVAAFLPLYFVPGVMGKIFRVIPVVVISVFLVSLLECLLILPAHLLHGSGTGSLPFLGAYYDKQQKFSLWFASFVREKYGYIIHKLLSLRYITFSVGVAVLLVSFGYAASGRLGMTLFPKVEADFAVVNFRLPYGVHISKTEKIAKKIYDAAYRVMESDPSGKFYKGVYTQIGAGRNISGSHAGAVHVFLPDIEQRTLTTGKFVRRWREETGELKGLQYILFESDAGGPGSGAALSVELSHRNVSVLEAAAQELAAELKRYPRIKDIDDGYADGKPQLDFKIKPLGQELGLTAAYIARTLRNSYYGAEVTRQQRGREEVKVMVRLPEAERSFAYNLEERIITTPKGEEVFLGDVASVEYNRAYTSIDRKNGRRRMTVTGDVTPRSKAGEVIASMRKKELPKLMQKYPGLSYSFEGKQADMRESMQSLMLGLLMALFVIYALLAIPFKSYFQPAIIMLSIPFGIVGAVFGHLIMGYSLSMISMFGIVALSGVVVNDSLVLIELTNRKREEDAGAVEAVVDAAVERFRPIMLTTLTTFFGLTPMIFETSMQAKFLIPMAISLGYGILFATAITLVLVPCLYIIFEDIAIHFKAYKKHFWERIEKRFGTNNSN